MYKWWNLKKIVKERSQLHSLKCWILEAIRRFLNKKLEVKGIWTGGKCISSWAYEVGKIKKTLVLRDFSREFSVFWKIENPCCTTSSLHSATHVPRAYDTMCISESFCACVMGIILWNMVRYVKKSHAFFFCITFCIIALVSLHLTGAVKFNLVKLCVLLPSLFPQVAPKFHVFGEFGRTPGFSPSSRHLVPGLSDMDRSWLSYPSILSSRHL